MKVGRSWNGFSKKCCHMLDIFKKNSVSSFLYEIQWNRPVLEAEALQKNPMTLFKYFGILTNRMKGRELFMRFNEIDQFLKQKPFKRIPWRFSNILGFLPIVWKEENFKLFMRFNEIDQFLKQKPFKILWRFLLKILGFFLIVPANGSLVYRLFANSQSRRLFAQRPQNRKEYRQ